MAEIVTVKDLHAHVDREVTLQGWLYNSRASGKIAFLIVRDGTGLCQCVLQAGEQTAARFDEARHLPQESSLRVTGTVRPEPRAVGGFELQLSGFQVIQRSRQYPITPKAHGIDFLMQHRHLWLRSRRQHAVMRVRHTLIDAIRRFFNDRGFTLIDTPILSPSAGEGAATLFEVDYFGEPVYLAQTGQLYLEAACMSHGKVYCFGPTFRAERSKTRRHLTEFWMVEPEIAYAELDDLVALGEDLVCAIVHRVLTDHRPELELLERDVRPLEGVAKPFVRLSYAEAVQLLKGEKTRALLDGDLKADRERVRRIDRQIEDLQNQHAAARKERAKDKLAQDLQAVREERSELIEQLDNIPHHLELAQNFEWGKDLGGSDETIVSRLHDGPVVVHRYPKQAKAFYMKADPHDPRVVLNFDLLAPEGYGEIIGGSQREDHYEALLARIDEENLPRSKYEWYLDLRRLGSVPHGGFGLGVERTLAWLCGLKHIRESIPFPRLMGKVYP